MDDTTEARYQKMKSVAEHYRIIQIGLCLFHLDAANSKPDEPKFIARPYNFYLFPAGQASVNMEASAIEFNKQHNMDFNRWIYEGIPYVTDAGEQEVREKFYGSGEGWTKEEQRAAKANGMQIDDDSASSSSAAPPVAAVKEEKKKKTITLDKEGDISFVNGVKAQIAAWCATRGEVDHELLLPECNSFLRLAIHQWFETVTGADVLGACSKENVFLETRPVPNQKWKSAFVLCHYTASERAGLAATAASKKRADYEARIGFKSVWNALRSAGRPIVTHNGFYDVLFMWSHFEAATLPATLSEFKLDLGKKFPAGVYDTKFLSGSRQFMFPMEFLAKETQRIADGAAAGTEVAVSSSLKQRLDGFRAMNVPVESLTQCRFRETHLEKLYLVLQQEEAARTGTTVPEPTKETSGPSLLASSGSSAVVSPPPPHGGVSITLAPSFSKYALIGQPGGDASAAHEAGYDAYMTAYIFAHFLAEAPAEQLMSPLRLEDGDGVSQWRNRIPLYRHLMALNLNVDASTGQPIDDSLVDETSTIYLMKGFPREYTNGDIQRSFENGYVSAKRKMATGEGADEGETTKPKIEPTSASSDAMTDVAPPVSSASVADSSPSPSPVIVTAQPKVIWISDESLFLCVPIEDTSKFDAFLQANAKNTEVFAEGIVIEKYAEPATKQK